MLWRRNLLRLRLREIYGFRLQWSQLNSSNKSRSGGELLGRLSRRCTVHHIRHAPKWKCHFDKIFITCYTWICQNDWNRNVILTNFHHLYLNLSKWLEQKCHFDEIFVTVWTGYCKISTAASAENFIELWHFHFSVVVLGWRFIISYKRFMWWICCYSQGCFTGTGAILWLPQCQWSNPEEWG